MAGQSPQEFLDALFRRAASVQPPVPDPPGNEWSTAVGALMALSTCGMLTDDEIRAWEERAQQESERIRSAEPASVMSNVSLSPSGRATVYTIRLQIVDALLAALDRRGEVCDAIASAADDRAAISAVAGLLGVGPRQAKAVIDLRLSKFSEAETQRLRREQHDLQAAIKDLDRP